MVLVVNGMVEQQPFGFLTFLGHDCTHFWAPGRVESQLGSFAAIWVAVRALKLSYQKSNTILFTTLFKFLNSNPAMWSQAQDCESGDESLEAVAKAFTITVLPPTGQEAGEGDEGSRAPSLSVLLAERSKLKSARSKRHGPALWWSSQEQRLERTVRDLDYPDDTELELSSLLDSSKFSEGSASTAQMCLHG